MEVIYIGPDCTVCGSNEYTKVPLTPTLFWKKCADCGFTTKIVDGELTEKPAE